MGRSDNNSYELAASAAGYGIYGDSDIVRQLQAASAAAQQAHRLGAQQAIDAFEAQKKTLGDSLEAANRSTANAYYAAMNPFGAAEQSVRSAGLAGSGWSETSRAGFVNEYQNNLAANRSDYGEALNEINLAIEQARQKGDIAALNAAQEYAVEIANALYKQQKDAADAARYEQERLYKQMTDERNFNYTLERDGVADARYADSQSYNRLQDQLARDYDLARDAVADARYAQEWQRKYGAQVSQAGGTGQSEGGGLGGNVAQGEGLGLLSVPGTGAPALSGTVEKLLKNLESSGRAGGPSSAQVRTAIDSVRGRLSDADIEYVLDYFGYTRGILGTPKASGGSLSAAEMSLY